MNTYLRYFTEYIIFLGTFKTCFNSAESARKHNNNAMLIIARMKLIIILLAKNVLLIEAIQVTIIPSATIS